MFSSQVTAFDNRIGSKYLLESDLTSSNLDVSPRHVVEPHLQFWMNKRCTSDYDFAGILLGATTRYSLTILQVRTYSRCSEYLFVCSFLLFLSVLQSELLLHKNGWIIIIAITKNTISSVQVPDWIIRCATSVQKPDRTNISYTSKVLITV